MSTVYTHYDDTYCGYTYYGHTYYGYTYDYAWKMSTVSAAMRDQNQSEQSSEEYSCHSKYSHSEYSEQSRDEHSCHE